MPSLIKRITVLDYLDGTFDRSQPVYIDTPDCGDCRIERVVTVPGDNPPTFWVDCTEGKNGRTGRYAVELSTKLFQVER